MTVMASIDSTSMPTDWDIVGSSDFNGDNHLDVVLRNQTLGQVYVWLMEDGQKSGGLAMPGIALDWTGVA